MKHGKKRNKRNEHTHTHTYTHARIHTHKHKQNRRNKINNSKKLLKCIVSLERPQQRCVSFVWGEKKSKISKSQKQIITPKTHKVPSYEVIHMRIFHTVHVYNF